MTNRALLIASGMLLYGSSIVRLTRDLFLGDWALLAIGAVLVGFGLADTRR